MVYMLERKYEGRKYGKYVFIGIVFLILFLVGYLYFRGSFDNFGVFFFGNLSGFF